jgi:uncharacterized membrane protein
MSELIAIPIESDRRAVEVLGALRRLEAEYACPGAAACGPAAADEAARALAAETSRRRRVRRRLALAAFAAVALSASEAGGALLGHAAGLAAGFESVPGAFLAVAGGALLAITAVALLLRRRRAPASSGGGSTVPWLVAYAIRDRLAPGARRVRATVHQVSLPVEAEGRLKAILARADAPAAR